MINKPLIPLTYTLLMLLFCTSCAQSPANVSANAPANVHSGAETQTFQYDGLSGYVRALNQVMQVNPLASLVAVKGEWIDLNMVGTWTYTFQVGLKQWTYTPEALLLQHDGAPLPSAVVVSQDIFYEAHNEVQKAMQTESDQFQLEWFYDTGWNVKKVN